MSKYKKTHQPSSETIDEAFLIARGIQKSNQTKEQTKLIAQGIQKGIAEYKKQQKGKARELGRLKKKITQQQNNAAIKTATPAIIKCKIQWLPWTLLLLSWLSMALFFLSVKDWI